MYKKRKLSAAIVATVAGCTGSLLVDAAALEEIVVTATKRSESAQDIPVAVQALGEESLEQLNVTSFDDYVKYLPNVSRGGRGPGQNEIYIRGMASDASTISVSEAQGSSPTVALYLDEQPVTTGGRNLDIYITDIERVEVLAGPQGTLYGASSEAGTVRIITNKPDLYEFGAGLDAGISSTKSGEMSNSTEAYINIPLIEEKLAVRIAVYNDNKGGYIDNVYGVTTIDPVVSNINRANAGVIVPEDGSIPIESADNRALVEDNFNDSSYQGARFGVKYAINDDWDVLLQHTAQTLNVDGVFDYDPAVGDLQTQRFFKDELTDELGLTAWTLNGRLGALEMVYTGGYVDREVSQSLDYTGYNNVSGFAGTYTCLYDANFVATECFSPVKGFTNEISNTRQTHEFRITTDPDRAVRLTAGIFYDDAETESDGTFFYQGTADAFNTGNPNFGHNIRDPLTQVGGPGSDITLIDPTARLPGEGFINDITRTEQQTAVFGEVSVDMGPVTATVGFRAYELEIALDGFSGGAFAGPERNLDAKHGTQKTDDVIPKFNLSYEINDDVMIFATYSEGYRPGGFNRGGGEPANNPDFGIIPLGFDTDNVENVEFGWKTDLLDGRLRWNGTIYSVDWTDIQVARFDPTNLTITTFVDNSLDAEILGLETDLTVAINDNYTLFGALSYNDTEVAAIGSAIFADLLPALGSPLPLTPELQYNLRLRHDGQLGEYDSFWQVGMVYADDTVGALLLDDALPQDDYTIWDASAGVSKDGWSLALYFENLTDERAQLHFNKQDDVPRITTNRPRTIGLRFSYDFE